MSAYAWLSQGLLGSVNLFGQTDVAQRIKNSDIAVDFVRPLDVQAASIALEVGRSLFALLPRGIPSVLIGAVVVGMSLPTTPLPYLLGALSVVLAIVLSCTTGYLVAVARFWLVEGCGLELFSMIDSGFLAGLFVPVPLFPATAARVLTPVSALAEVVDLAVEEPDVEDVVRRVYAARRRRLSGSGEPPARRPRRSRCAARGRRRGPYGPPRPRTPRAPPG